MTTAGVRGWSEDPFATALTAAIGRVGPDGRVTREDARALRRALGRSPADRASLLADAETVLGPFESLSPQGRGALLDTLAWDERWRMAGYDLGPVHASLARALWRLARRRKGRWGHSVAESLAISARTGPRVVLHALGRLTLSWRARFGWRPKLRDFLIASGAEVRYLCALYARDIVQRPSYRGFWHSETRRTTVGLILGLDFVEADDGCWLIESNMNCGLDPGRTRLYQEDPFVRSVLDLAAGHGFRNLAVLAGITSVDALMTKQYHEGAAARGIAITLLEDAHYPRYDCHSRSARVPRMGESSILLRNRHYWGPLDFLVHHKRASMRALRRYQQESGDESFRLPTTSVDPRPRSSDPADPFPNVVFKFTQRDNGEGVIFLKVSSPEQAPELLAESMRTGPAHGRLTRLNHLLGGQEAIYQTYVPGILSPDRRLYKTRAYVALTPIGEHFLSAQRMVCARPVPDRLPFGVVRDQSPFLVSWRPGARLEVLPREKESEVRSAALGVARGLSHAIRYGFACGSDSLEERPSATATGATPS
jgi:hypothetical protein